MFGRKEEEKRSLDDMFTPRDEVALSEEEAVETVAGECEKVAENDVVSDYNNEPIKPLSCFGMEEGKTEKWLIKCAKVWFCFMSFLWFLFGAMTFAPVIYVGNKVNVIFKNKKKSLLLAALIHIVLVLVVVLLIVVR